MSPKKRLQERIKHNVTIDAETGCWLWGRQKSNTGYPRMNIRVNGVHLRFNAHRVSLSVFVREPKPGEEAAHKPHLCPFKTCVNPKHLYWATREQNEADKRHPRRIRLPERVIHFPLGREKFAVAA